MILFKGDERLCNAVMAGWNKKAIARDSHRAEPMVATIGKGKYCG
ncbi:hypothetical protein [Microcoleus anatoxicus]